MHYACAFNLNKEHTHVMHKLTHMRIRITDAYVDVLKMRGLNHILMLYLLKDNLL